VTTKWNEVLVRIKYRDGALTPGGVSRNEPSTESELVDEIDRQMNASHFGGQIQLEKLDRIFVLREIQGGGCDYTIGCGERLRTLQTLGRPGNIVEAEHMAVTNPNFLGNIEEFEDGGEWHETGPLTPGWPPESRLDQARILEVVTDKEIDLAAYIAASQARIDSYQAKADEEDERAEYERLKAKYGDSV